MYFLSENNEKFLKEEIIVNIKMWFSGNEYKYGYNITKMDTDEKIQGEIIFESINEKKEFEQVLESLKLFLKRNISDKND